MRGFDEAASGREWGAHDPIDAEVLDCDRDSAYVSCRIDRSELVEVDLLELHSVNPSLGLGEPPKSLLGPEASSVGKGRSLDQLAHLSPRSARAVRLSHDFHLSRSDPVAARVSLLDFEPVERQ